MQGDEKTIRKLAKALSLLQEIYENAIAEEGEIFLISWEGLRWNTASQWTRSKLVPTIEAKLREVEAHVLECLSYKSEIQKRAKNVREAIEYKGFLKIDSWTEERVQSLEGFPLLIKKILDDAKTTLAIQFNQIMVYGFSSTNDTGNKQTQFIRRIERMKTHGGKGDTKTISKNEKIDLGMGHMFFLEFNELKRKINALKESLEFLKKVEEDLAYHQMREE